MFCQAELSVTYPSARARAAPAALTAGDSDSVRAEMGHGTVLARAFESGYDRQAIDFGGQATARNEWKFERSLGIRINPNKGQAGHILRRRPPRPGDERGRRKSESPR